MEQNSESDYRLLPSYIFSTRSVLNPINQDLRASVMQLSLLIIQLTGMQAEDSQLRRKV